MGVVLLPDASTADAGIAEIATGAEVRTGTDNTRLITPRTLRDQFNGRLNLFFESDFLNNGLTQEIWVGTPLSAGTSNTNPILAMMTKEHPGLVLLRSAAAANSGYRYTTDAVSMIMGGGEEFNVVFGTAPVQTNITLRMGFLDNATSADATDGIYFECIAGVLTGKTANAGVYSTSPSLGTLAASTWYHARIVVNEAYTSAVFTVYNDAGTLVGTQTLTTNFPGTTRATGCGLIVTDSGSTAIDLMHLDYMCMKNNRILQRGAAT